VPENIENIEVDLYRRVRTAPVNTPATVKENEVAQKDPPPDPPAPPSDLSDGGKTPTDSGDAGKKSTNTDSQAPDGSPEQPTGTGGSATANNPPSAPVAFGGRPKSKQASTPEEATRRAKEKLNDSRSATKQGDQAGALAAAIEAYDISSEHAEGSPDCSRLARDAERLIETLGKHQSVDTDAVTAFK